MSIQDERELRDRLGALLYGIEPGPPPVAGTVRRGQGDQDAPVDLGRRPEIAVLAAGAVALPGLLRGHPAAPMAPPHYKVIVIPVGAGARPGLIGQGIDRRAPVDGVMSADGRDGVMLTGRGFRRLPSYQDFATQFTANPAALETTGSGATVLEFGTLRADVTHVVISLPDGEVVSLAPVSWRGRSWVAVQLPPGCRSSGLSSIQAAVNWPTPSHSATLS